MYAFIFTMVLALSVKSMGIMWIAIEGTTLASAFFSRFLYNDKQALEAAWKYDNNMLCGNCNFASWNNIFASCIYRRTKKHSISWIGLRCLTMQNY
jgi:hypothetical protein